MRLRGMRVRLCLRGGRPVTVPHASLPDPELLRRQSGRLRGIRARLLRNAQVGLRRRILDLGCGYGAVTHELVRRGSGMVIALDRQQGGLSTQPEAFAGAKRVCGLAESLPFASASFDLVYSQFALLWMDAPSVISEVRRVLEPGGVFIAVEPDYGGMLEAPASIRTQPIWQNALRRAGADPQVGRSLPLLLANQGFDVRVALVPELMASTEDRFELLRELPLSEQERDELDRIAQASSTLTAPWTRLIHLPLFLMTAVLLRDGSGPREARLKPA